MVNVLIPFRGFWLFEYSSDLIGVGTFLVLIPFRGFWLFEYDVSPKPASLRALYRFNPLPRILVI